MTNFILLADQIVNFNMPSIQNSILTKIMEVITFLGDNYFLLSLGIIIFYYLYKTKRPESFAWIITLFGAAATGYALKYLIMRERPVNQLIVETGYSFPSGHAVMATIFFVLLILVFKDQIKNKILKNTFIIICSILIPLIAFSRIYLSVHWLSDVIFGMIIGASWIFVYKAILNSRHK